jgi:hypothetical protein
MNLDDPPAVASRVTVDIDSYHSQSRLRVQRAYHGLARAGAETVEVAVSSSGTGYHVAAYFDEPLTTAEKESLRMTYGDDPKRALMDRIRSRHGLVQNVMWSEKSSNEGERQVFDTPEGAIEYVERTRAADADRMRALVNHGRRSLIDAEIPHTREMDR